MNREMGQRLFRWLLAFGAGVALGLLLAPKTGRGARSWMGQKAEHLRNVLNIRDFLERRAKYERGRFTGVMHRAREITGGVGERPDIDDDLITQRVRTALGENQLTWRIPRINVDTVNRIVTLRGRAADAGEKQSLANVAAAVKGVDSIINKVTIGSRQAAG